MWHYCCTWISYQARNDDVFCARFLVQTFWFLFSDQQVLACRAQMKCGFTHVFLLHFLNQILWHGWFVLLSGRLPFLRECICLQESISAQEAKAERKCFRWTCAVRQHSSAYSWVVKTLSSSRSSSSALLPDTLAQQGTLWNSPHLLRKTYMSFHDSSMWRWAPKIFWAAFSFPKTPYWGDFELRRPHDHTPKRVPSLDDDKNTVLLMTMMLTLSIVVNVNCTSL